MIIGAICFMLGGLVFCVGCGFSFVGHAINRLADAVEALKGGDKNDN